MSDERWLSQVKYEELLNTNPDRRYCPYSPPRGDNKDKFCGARVKNYLKGGEIAAIRCEDCQYKEGRYRLIFKENKYCIVYRELSDIISNPLFSRE